MWEVNPWARTRTVSYFSLRLSKYENTGERGAVKSSVTLTADRLCRIKKLAISPPRSPRAPVLILSPHDQDVTIKMLTGAGAGNRSRSGARNPLPIYPLYLAIRYPLLPHESPFQLNQRGDIVRPARRNFRHDMHHGYPRL